jgi:TonB-linked SusC/RagA family outer membrane protein
MLGVFAICTQLWAQRTITGTVTDQNGNPLPNVSVQVKGTTAGTVSGDNGTFALNVPANGRTLVFSTVGMATREINIGNQSAINITLQSADQNLQEVVVVGYGTQAQRTRTQAASVIRADEFRNMPIISPTQALQGQAAGVNMVNSSGVLGAASNVQVRGPSSLQSSATNTQNFTQPLYVIDGVPLNDDVLSSQQGGGTGLNPLLDLNPSDIESMTVLKDAAAVSIYGSRGTNGVILIKTRRGANQKTRINLDVFNGTSRPTELLDMMDADQFRAFRTAYVTLRGGATPTLPTGNFDWTDAVTRQGKVGSYSLSASGGNEKTRFFLNGSYYDETGYTIGNDLNRLSGRINLDHDLSRRFKIGTNFSISNSKSDRIGAENNTYAPLTAAALQLPYIEPRDANGIYVNTGFIPNILALEELGTNAFISYRNVGSVFGEATIIDNLKFRSEWGIDNQQTEERNRVVNIIQAGGTASRTVQQNQKWLATHTLNYEKRFKDHFFGGLLGHSFERTNYEAIQVAASGFANDNLPNVASGSTPTTTFASRSASAIEGIFSRLNYRFKERYLFEGTVRRDGSSRFGADRQYGTFWAVSGGWIVSSENFFRNVNFINNLKLTASYGTSGNDRIGGDFPSLGLFQGGIGADYLGQPGLNPTQTPNPSLQWEETTQWDIGLSASMLRSRINLNLNVYNKRTNNNLIPVPLPFTTGFPSINQNIGEVENKGIDLELNTVNVRSSKFEWNTSLNVGFLKNTVLSLPANSTKDPEGRAILPISNAQRAIVGESRNTFYLIRYSGINPQTGDAEWLTKDGKVTNNPTADDRVIVGSAIPDFTGGFTNSVRFYGFDLTAFFNFSYGNKVLIDGLRFTENLGTASFNKATNVLNYWKQAGDQAFAPRLASSTAPIFNQLSTLQLQDGSYARLKTLSLGYRIPKSVLDRTRVISSARFYVMGQNLFIIQDKDFRGPDAEVSGNGASLIQGESFFALPQSKSFTVGVNIVF